MKRKFNATLTLALAMVAGNALAGGFTQGDIVVMRDGDGSAALSNASTAAFLQEYTTGGSLVQTIAMPTTDIGSRIH